MDKKTIVPRSLSDHAEPISGSGAAAFQYRVVYSNGLNEPVETLIGSSAVLALDDEDVSEMVCQFVQRSIDMDCRQLLFIYQEFPFTD